MSSLSHSFDTRVLKAVDDLAYTSMAKRDSLYLILGVTCSCMSPFIESAELLQVCSCLRLLKKFSMENDEPNLFSSANNDKNEEVAQFGRKYQITEQIIELPLEHQVFDMIVAEGSAGLTLKEVYIFFSDFLEVPDIYPLFGNICSAFVLAIAV